MAFATSLILGKERGSSTLAVTVTIFIVVITLRTLLYRRGLRAVGHLPGIRVLFHPFSLPGALIPTNSWNPGFAFLWNWRKITYETSDTVSIVSYLSGPPTICTSNLEVARQIAAANGSTGFEKPEATFVALLQYGRSLLTANGDTWRKHRRITGPAFSHKLYKAVWLETVKSYHEMVDGEGWSSKESVDVPIVQTLTFKFALIIIGKCAFGFPFDWSEPVQNPDGKMNLLEAFHMVSKSTTIDLFVPGFVQNLLPVEKFKKNVEAKRELMQFVRGQVAEGKASLHCTGSEGSTAKKHFLPLLIEASERENEKLRLNDSELIGNVFIFLFAGHETTAQGLTAAIGFLASHHDVQEEIYQHVVSVIGQEGDPVYDDYSKLNKVLAAFYEAVRMFPAGFLLMREAADDVVLHVPDATGEATQSVHVEKGTQVIVDMVGLHYNPRYFEDPDEYKPSRWYTISNEADAFTAFSLGPRACIGRKFATTEAVAFLAMLIRDHRIDPLLKGDEDIAQWKKRVLDGTVLLSLGVKEVPVTFTKRTKH